MFVAADQMVVVSIDFKIMGCTSWGGVRRIQFCMSGLTSWALTCQNAESQRCLDLCGHPSE